VFDSTRDLSLSINGFIISSSMSPVNSLKSIIETSKRNKQNKINCSGSKQLYRNIYNLAINLGAFCGLLSVCHRSVKLVLLI
jgi:hypothetical protein